jgi:hypothetical protein
MMPLFVGPARTCANCLFRAVELQWRTDPMLFCNFYGQMPPEPDPGDFRRGKALVGVDDEMASAVLGEAHSASRRFVEWQLDHEVRPQWVCPQWREEP